MPGHYIARTFGGTAGSLPITKKGDAAFGPTANATAPYSYGIAGILQCPSGGDNSLYFSPIWIVEPNSPSLRGRMRGMYQPLHSAANFADGQIIQGSGDYAGKTFMFIRPGISLGSVFALEISPTVETNQ